jgi:hypothetical protein
VERPIFTVAFSENIGSVAQLPSRALGPGIQNYHTGDLANRTAGLLVGCANHSIGITVMRSVPDPLMDVPPTCNFSMRVSTAQATILGGTLI